MKLLHWIGRVYAWILKLATALLAIVMFTLLCTTTWQVLSRYVCEAPQTWPTDIATYGLVFLTFIGMGVLLRDDGHIAVDVAYMRMPLKCQRVLDVAMDVVGVVTVLVVTYFAIQLDIDYYTREIFLVGSVFYTPKAYVFSFIPIGLTITAIEYIRRLVLHVRILIRNEPPEGRQES